MPADALATLGAGVSAGMVLSREPPKPEYSVSSIRKVNINGLVQDCSNSSAQVME